MHTCSLRTLFSDALLGRPSCCYADAHLCVRSLWHRNLKKKYNIQPPNAIVCIRTARKITTYYYICPFSKITQQDNVLLANGYTHARTKHCLGRSSGIWLASICCVLFFCIKNNFLVVVVGMKTRCCCLSLCFAQLFALVACGTVCVCARLLLLSRVQKLSNSMSRNFRPVARYANRVGKGRLSRVNKTNGTAVREDTLTVPGDAVFVAGGCALFCTCSAHFHTLSRDEEEPAR